MPARRAVRRLRRRVARRRVRLDIDARRTQLLALAKAEFSDRAYDDVSIDDLAKRARISKGLLYHYFPTKRDLYVAGLREIAADLVAALTSAPDHLAPIERVKQSLDAYLDYITRHAGAFVSLMRGGIGSDPEVAAVIDHTRSQLFARFLDGSPFGPALAGNLRFETAIKGWIGFVEAASLEWVRNAAAQSGPRLARDELRDLFADVLFEVIRVVLPTAVTARTPPAE